MKMKIDWFALLIIGGVATTVLTDYSLETVEKDGKTQYSIIDKTKEAAKEVKEKVKEVVEQQTDEFQETEKFH